MTQAVRHEEMRARNLEVVLGEVSRNGPLTRAALADLTGLTKSTVSKLVGDLVDAGLLAETGPARAGERGRPGVDVVLSGARIASLGLEINVDYLAVRVLDLTGAVRFAARRDRDNRGSRPKKVLGRAAVPRRGEAITEGRRLGLDPRGARCSRCPARWGDGVLFSAPNLGWQDVRAADSAAPARPGRAGQRSEPRRARQSGTAAASVTSCTSPAKSASVRAWSSTASCSPGPGGWRASWGTSSWRRTAPRAAAAGAAAWRPTPVRKPCWRPEGRRRWPSCWPASPAATRSPWTACAAAGRRPRCRAGRRR